MSNPKRDLIEAILELREAVEKELKLNKYYVAMAKLDELLAGIRPLEAIEIPATRTEAPAPAPEPVPETIIASAPVSEPDGSERSWSGVVQETVVDELRPS